MNVVVFKTTSLPVQKYFTMACDDWIVLLVSIDEDCEHRVENDCYLSLLCVKVSTIKLVVNVKKIAM